MHTLSKLDNIDHVQAIGAAARGLLEISVDALLIHADQSEDVGEIAAWNLSAQYKAKTKLKRFREKLTPRPIAKLAELDAWLASPEAAQALAGDGRSYWREEHPRALSRAHSTG